MKLKELKEKDIEYYDDAYGKTGIGDSWPILRSDIFRLMGAEELNLSILDEIEGWVEELFPIKGKSVRTQVSYLEEGMGIELSGRVARVTFSVTTCYLDGCNIKNNRTYEKEYIMYIYKYDNVWYVL